MSEISNAARTDRSSRGLRRFIAGFMAGVAATMLTIASWKLYDQVLLRNWNYRDPFPPSTRFVISNATEKEVLVQRIRLGDQIKEFNRHLAARRDTDQKLSTYLFIHSQPQKRYREELEVWYRVVDNGEEKHAILIADRRPRDRCQFVLFLRADSPKLSECRRSDLEDFD